MSKSRFILSAVGAALVAPSAFAQTWDDKVTITTGAQPVGQVVAELAKASGLPMSVSGLAQNDIVFMSLKDVTVRVAAEKIAAATGSKWVEEQGVFTLTRNAGDERRQWDADAKTRREEIDQAIAESTKQLDQAMTAKGANALAGGAYGVLGMIKLLPPDQLAGLEPDQRVVYSSSNTAMQRSLPAGAMNLARQIVADEIARTEAMVDRLKGVGNEQGRPNRALQGMMQQLDHMRSAKIGKVLLILQNQGGSMLIARADVIDAQNQILAGGSLMLQVDPNRRFRAPEQNPVNPGGEPLALSDRAKSLAALWRLNGGIKPGAMFAGAPAGGAVFEMTVVGGDLGASGAPQEQIADTVRSLAARPDVNEPLGFFASELLQLAADSEHAGIVACIPDAAMQPAADAVMANASAKKVWDDIKKMEMTATLMDGIYVVSPRLQSRSRYERMNRTAVAGLVADASKKGYPSLDDLGRYAMNSSRGAFSGPLDTRLIAIAHPEAGNALRRNANNQEALAIFSALGPQKRETMAKNKTVYPLSSIGVRDETTWLTYNSLDGPQYRSNTRMPNDMNAAERELVGAKMAIRQDAGGLAFMPTSATQIGPYRERTEMLPNGLPSSTTVSLSASLDSVLRASENQDQTARTAMLSPEALGAVRAQRDSPAFADARSKMPEYRVFTMAEQGNYVITITYADNYTMTRTLQEVQITPDAKPMAYADLPENIRQRADRTYQQTYEAMKNMKIGGGRGDGKVPPP
jgi:hypothetical protein